MTDSFVKPASYWLGRAERCLFSGNELRAAVLARQALSIEPYDAEATLLYTLTLHRLGCYEASNREAFAALCRNPAQTLLYGVIAMNMYELDLRSEAADAWALYLDHLHDVDAEEAPWDDEDGELLFAEADASAPRLRRMRFYSLLGMALRRMQKGDWESAKHALERAEASPFAGYATQLYPVKAQLLTAMGEGKQAANLMRNAMRLRPKSAQIAAAAAQVFAAQGCRSEAASALMRSVCLAENAEDRFCVENAAEALHQPMAVYALCKRELVRNPNRYAACYNLSVSLLKMGRLEEAAGYLHRCRELDPDDVSGEAAFRLLTAMEAMEPSRRLKASKQLRYYGRLSPVESELCLRPLVDRIAADPARLLREATEDGRLCNQLLMLLQTSAAQLSHIPMHIARDLPAEEAIYLLRRLLVTGAEDTLIKRMACTQLKELGEKPPFLTYTPDGLCLCDLSDPRGEMSLKDRRITLKLKEALELRVDGGFLPWALRAVHHMDRGQRLLLALDRDAIWPIALKNAYLKTCGKPLSKKLTGDETLMKAIAIIEQADRKGRKADGDH